MRPITGRVLAARGSDVRIGVTAWAPLGAISVVAGWLMLAAAWIGLGLDPVHPWLMILLVTVVADDLSPDPGAARTIKIDIADLLEDLGATDDIFPGLVDYALEVLDEAAKGEGPENFGGSDE